MLMQLIIETAIQWIVFFILPVLCYLVFFRKIYSFPAYIGLKKPVIQSDRIFKRDLIITAVVTLAFMLYSTFLSKKYEIGGDDIRLLSYLQTGWSLQTLLIIFVQSILRTSFLEELIFRGFIINTISHKLSFTITNHIQAIIFTVIHIFGLVQMKFSMPDIIISTITIYIMSLFFGKLFKESNGSMIYSGIFHGVSNIFAALLIIL